MTDKSTDTILAQLTASGELVRFIPVGDPDECCVRDLFMGSALHHWCYQPDRKQTRDYKANIRAFLGRFVKGGYIDNVDFMKCWRDDVFEFRVQMEPRRRDRPNAENTRIFGAFIRRDTFVAFHPPRLRSSFASDADWDKAIDRTIAQWEALFGVQPRIPARPFSNCVSSNFFDAFS